MNDQIIASDKLLQFVEEVFQFHGFNPPTAKRAAQVLVLSDLRGIESHGVARLSGYIRLREAGKINPNAQPNILRETSSTARLDADGGLGLYMGSYAMDIAIEKALNHGSGWVAVSNSSHFGIAAAHAMKALEHNMIGFAMTNASPLVAPAGGKERLLGTNPICWVFPAGKKRPFVLDMATTVVANGKLEVAQRKGVNIPFGYAQDKDGLPTEDANALKYGGSMLPLGGSLPFSSYKGYGLGASVDIFTGVLSGANFGPWVPPFVPFLQNTAQSVGKGIGHFLGVWNVDAFMDADEFKNSMDVWIERFTTSTPTAEVEKVLIPGEKEFDNESDRLQNGIPINEKVWEVLCELDRNCSLKILT